MAETRIRSITKGVTWRALATLTTALLVYIFTGNLALSFSVGFLDIVIKLAFYYGHERIWQKITWGHNAS